MSISCGAPCSGWRAGIAAAALPAAVGCGCGGAGAGSGFLPSSSRISAPSPRPRAFLAIGNYLLSQVRVAFSPFALLVVKDNRFAETGRFGQANISRNDAFENLPAKERAQVVRNLARERGAVVVHREQDASISKLGLSVRRMRISVSSSSETPSKARYSH